MSEMTYRKLGRSGLKVSSLSFGAWVTFGDPAVRRENEACLHLAYERGINFFDNAEGYADGAAEEVMGDILRASGWSRDSYCVSSKVFFGIRERRPTQKGLSRKHIVEACHDALKRLKLDYLDLYFCHRHDPETPVEEVVLTMNSLIQQGKILYWGTSEWPVAKLLEAYAIARDYRLEGPTMEQPQYNLLHRANVEVNLAPIFAEYGLGTTIWSPLASGFLTGKYLDGVPEGSRLAAGNLDWLRRAWLEDEAKQERCRRLNELAQSRGLSLTHLSLAWCLKNPHVSTVILGASRPSQLEDNLQALDLLPQLDDDLMQAIDAVCPVWGRR